MSNKCKIVVMPGVSQLQIKSKKGQQISEQEVYAINNGEVSGLAKVEVIPKRSKFLLIFDTSDLCSLEEYFRTPLTKKTFSQLLCGILTSFQNVNDANFNFRHVYLDYDKVFISAATHEVVFIYVPIQGFDADGNIHDFFQNIVQKCTFSNREDLDYVTEYINIFNDSPSFSVFDVENYLETIRSSHKTETIICPCCAEQIEKGKPYCPKCGEKIMDDLMQTQRLPSMDEFTKQMERLQDNPHLVRQNTGEQIAITSTVFFLGQSAEKCSYCIADNSMVSRVQVGIIKRKNGYFAMDMRATNTTALNGVEMEPAAEIRISEGDKISFAGEEFTFYEH